MSDSSVHGWEGNAITKQVWWEFSQQWSQQFIKALLEASEIVLKITLKGLKKTTIPNFFCS